MPSDECPPLATVAAARETLQEVDRSRLEDHSAARVLNALEELDNVILNASTDELAQAACEVTADAD